MAERAGDAEPAARTLIVEAMERQLSGHADGVPRAAPLSLEELDEHGRERLLSALSVIAEDTGMELGVDEDRAQATLRGMDPIGREVARQAALEVVDRKLQAADVPPLLLRTRGSLSSKVRQLGEQALWEMQMEGRPELAELMGTLHYRFSYGQNALLHCEETGHICGVLAAELGMSQAVAREAGMLHDIGKAVDHDVEGSHAIIGGELLRVLGADPGIIHAVKAHHFDEEPTTDLAMLTICADAISASRPGARRDTLATYLARLEQLQTIATRHSGVERAFPLQAGREVRIFVRAKQVKDAQVAELSTADRARDRERDAVPGDDQGHGDPRDHRHGHRAGADRGRAGGQPAARQRRRGRRTAAAAAATSTSAHRRTTSGTPADRCRVSRRAGREAVERRARCAPAARGRRGARRRRRPRGRAPGMRAASTSRVGQRHHRVLAAVHDQGGRGDRRQPVPGVMAARGGELCLEGARGDRPPRPVAHLLLDEVARAPPGSCASTAPCRRSGTRPRGCARPCPAARRTRRGPARATRWALPGPVAASTSAPSLAGMPHRQLLGDHAAERRAQDGWRARCPGRRARRRRRRRAARW